MNLPNELTTKGQEVFKQMYADAQVDVIRKKEQKAFDRTPTDAEWVTLRATGQGEMIRFSNRGWEMVSAVPLGAGAGIVRYIMRKRRLDIAAA